MQKQLNKKLNLFHRQSKGRITVATNMAGRGTDIMLGEDVHELGGFICNWDRKA